MPKENELFEKIIKKLEEIEEKFTYELDSIDGKLRDIDKALDETNELLINLRSNIS